MIGPPDAMNRSRRYGVGFKNTPCRGFVRSRAIWLPTPSLSQWEMAMTEIRTSTDKKGHMNRSDQLAEKNQREKEGKKGLKPAGEQGSRR
jgi:hypothetical protein